MGVVNLKSTLEITRDGPKHRISSLYGQTLVVDAAVWLHEFTISSKHISQMFHLGYEQDFDSELEDFLLGRVQVFTQFDISLIFVAEGDVNPAKCETNQKRDDTRLKQLQKLDELLKAGDLNTILDVHKCIKATTKNSARLWFSLKQFCTKHNFQLVSGVMEADPQLVVLN
jgi:hypothetical protein